MRRYCLEAIRINGAFGAYREAQTSITVNDAGRDINIKPGDKVFVPFVCFSFFFFIPFFNLWIQANQTTGRSQP